MRTSRHGDIPSWGAWGSRGIHRPPVRLRPLEGARRRSPGVDRANGEGAIRSLDVDRIPFAPVTCGFLLRRPDAEETDREEVKEASINADGKSQQRRSDVGRMSIVLTSER